MGELYRRTENPQLRPEKTATTGSEPVTVDELKDHLKITGTSEDTELAAFITAARTTIENMTSRVIVESEFSVWADTLTCSTLKIPLVPVISVDKFYWYDCEDTQTEIASTVFYVDNKSDNHDPRIMLRQDQSWPTGDYRYGNAIEIQVKAGYADDSVPDEIVQAIKMLAGYYYANRGDCSGGSGDCKGAGIMPLLMQFMVYRAI